MNRKRVRDQLRREFENNRISIILAVISIIMTAVMGFFVISKSINIRENKGIVGQGDVINPVVNNNNGVSAADVDYLSNKNVMETFDDVYGFDDVIGLVKQDPNLHFALIWRGSKEEYDKLDYRDKVPYVEYRVWDGATSTIEIIGP